LHRHNYPATFLERELVLRFLYENLKDKSKIRLGQRISNVDHNSKEVIVLCQNGTAISGDILVGCDGVYSTIREALWEVAGIQDPTAFDVKDKTLLMAEYQCLFGISGATDGIKDGEGHVNYSEGVSTAFFKGKDKVFWFIYRKLDKVYTVPNIPRYTKHDAEVYAASFQDLAICDDLKFRSVWENRQTFTLVATEQAQMKRWSWGRIACVGDSVHKMTPNMGAGGNTAME
jgi:2-polyprenyl-6-methoxyphenol hydroxylase-like FAD-dependent oxidoreductase